jgi:hypothetical protein
VNGIIDDKHCKILLDSGASACVTSQKFAKRIIRRKGTLIGPDGTNVKSIGKVFSNVKMEGLTRSLPMYVLDKMNSDYDAIIGVDGLKAFDIVLNFSENKVIYGARCESAEVNAIKEETKPISAIKEENNVVADVLSRTPEILAIDPCLTDDEFRVSQEQDPAFKKIQTSMVLNNVWRQNGKIFVPSCFKEQVLRSFHGRGIHFGITKTLELIQYSLFWPSMRVDIETFVRNCEICQVTKSTKPKPAPLQSLPSCIRLLWTISRIEHRKQISFGNC